MKKLLIAMTILSAAAASAWAQSPTDTQTVRSGNVDSGQSFQAPIAPPAVPSPTAPPVEVDRSTTQGVIPRALRHGRPWQMLNPGAPPQYGQAHENATHDPNDPGKPKGIKLFEWLF